MPPITCSNDTVLSSTAESTPMSCVALVTACCTLVPTFDASIGLNCCCTSFSNEIIVVGIVAALSAAAIVVGDKDDGDCSGIFSIEICTLLRCDKFGVSQQLVVSMNLNSPALLQFMASLQSSISIDGRWRGC